MIPFILGEEKQQLHYEIDGKDVSVIFDGTCRLGEDFALVLRFVDDDFSVQQHVVRMQLLAKSLSGDEIAHELITTLSTELGITPERLLASMQDRASCNNVAMRTIQVVYPNVLDIGCYSHTTDRIGEQFKVPTLDEFSRYWVSLFAHSPHARLLWQERTGQSVKTYSETRWWSKWEVFQQIMLLFGDVLPFLQENVDVSPTTRGKLIAHPSKKTFLIVELAVVINIVKATYSLEGDGPLVFSCFVILSTVSGAVISPHLPNTE